jgi:hypothetical protein
MMRDFSTYSFRPSCGEGGNKDHLLGGFLVGNAINYGVNLIEDPSLQYLFYLGQIGVSVSPLSNNLRHLEYLNNPFPSFFRRGLNVSLSTDSPLQVHHTQEPLIEEYSVASKVWKLSPTDMCEIARNSVLQSGFSHEFKQRALGELYFLSSSKGNDSKVTHLSDVRVAYRYETYHAEIDLLDALAGTFDHQNNKFPRAMFTEEEEDAMIKLVAKQTSKAADALAAKGGIIVASTDEAEIARMRNQRQILSKQLADAENQLESLKMQNRKLFDSYNEAAAKLAALKHSKQGIAQLVESANRRMARSRAAMGGGSLSEGAGIGGGSLSRLGGGGADGAMEQSNNALNRPQSTFSRMSHYGGASSTSPSTMMMANNNNNSGGKVGAEQSGLNTTLNSDTLHQQPSTMLGRESTTVPEMLHAAVNDQHRQMMEAEKDELSPQQARFLQQKRILEGSEAVFGRDGLFGGGRK